MEFFIFLKKKKQKITWLPCTLAPLLMEWRRLSLILEMDVGTTPFGQRLGPVRCFSVSSQSVHVHQRCTNGKHFYFQALSLSPHLGLIWYAHAHWSRPICKHNQELADADTLLKHSKCIYNFQLYFILSVGMSSFILKLNAGINVHIYLNAFQCQSNQFYVLAHSSSE